LLYNEFLCVGYSPCDTNSFIITQDYFPSFCVQSYAQNDTVNSVNY